MCAAFYWAQQLTLDIYFQLKCLQNSHSYLDKFWIYLKMVANCTSFLQLWLEDFAQQEQLLYYS